MKLFPIMLEVEEGMLGTVLRVVKDLPGVAKLHLDLDSVPAKSTKAKRIHQSPRLQPDPNRPKAKDVIIRALMQGPKHVQAIREELARNGYTKESSASGNLSNLRQNGVVEAGMGAGMHKLTDKFMKSVAKHHQQQNGAELPALPAPKPARPKAAPAKSRKSRSDGPTGIDIVLAMCRKASPGAVARDAIAAELAKGGFAARSIDGAVGKAKASGLISSSEKGFYGITEKGLKA